MSVEYDIVIADTTCFILLSKIDELEILKLLFGKVTTTETIANEFGQLLPDWVVIKKVTPVTLQQLADIDPGEASAISLALSSSAPLLILDDHKARQVAERLQLNFTGTFGVILKAKQVGLISSVTSIMEKIKQTNFRYSPAIIDHILNLADEL